MAEVLLDTDILSEYLKGFDQNVVLHARRYAEQYRRFKFTSVTVYEIVRGLEEKAAHSQVEKAIAWMGTNDEIVPNASDYLTAARTKARAKRIGRVVELPDCLIAAVASRLELTLVTGNTADYRSIQEAGLSLQLSNWRQP
ncbi:type II toxin-antitoxin system VapC family toxin [bacterium]|nr:MAG: type II toxin-antitoxin system VapC family toxin [bacterium]